MGMQVDWQWALLAMKKVLSEDWLGKGGSAGSCRENFRVHDAGAAPKLAID